MTDLTQFGFGDPCKPLQGRNKFDFMWKWMQEKKQVLGSEILAKLVATFGTIGKEELEWFYKLIYIYPLKRSIVCDMHNVQYDEWYIVLQENVIPKGIKARTTVLSMGGERCEFCEDKAVKLMVFKSEDVESVPLCDNDECFQQFVANHQYESFKVTRFSGWDTLDIDVVEKVVEDETGV